MTDFCLLLMILLLIIVINNYFNGFSSLVVYILYIF